MHDLGLEPWLVNVCRSLRIVKPFPIQVQCIPIILAGKDLIACAATGQGKTASYVLPLLHRFHKADAPFWFAVTLAPTRELALQVRDQICLFGSAIGVRVVALIGGESVCNQKIALLERPCHFVVATPGRLSDIISSDAILASKFSRVQVICFDECDKLLDISMRKAMDVILNAIPKDKTQKLCLSATLNQEIVTELRSKLSLAESAVYINLLGVVNPDAIDNSAQSLPLQELTPKTLKQMRYCCSATPVYHILHYLLTTPSSDFANSRGIVFCATIKECETLNIALQKLKVSIKSLHALQTQKERNANIDAFRSEAARVLIATNVAARGLDLPKVAWVINIDVPKEIDDYVHRVGRCARAGSPGVALTFVQQTLRHQDADKDVNTLRLKAIETALGRKLRRLQIDEEVVMMHPNRLHKAVARAKQLLEEQKFADKLATRQKRRRTEAELRTSQVN